MYYAGQLVNRSSNQASGTRNLPDAWLVSPLPEGYVKAESVPDQIVISGNALGEIKEYEHACDQETSERMFKFVCEFLQAYYGYFGTKNSDYYYPTMLEYVAPDSELKNLMDLALMDRLWVNTWKTTANNIELNGVYSNCDGSYDVIITSDVYEQSNYWNYEALDTTLRVTLIEAPERSRGYLVTATY